MYKVFLIVVMPWMKSLDGKERTLKMELIFMYGDKRPLRNLNLVAHQREEFIENTTFKKEENVMFTGFLTEFVY